jgi:mannose-6-phosphate isomerase-like protein (cupin superfamily)
MKTAYADIVPFVTKDQSTIRELLHPARHGVSAVSFAEATVEIGDTTAMHLHRKSEEIYHITAGAGTMRLGSAKFAIRPGDTIFIAPGTPHNVTSTGRDALKILCVSCPAYADDDTSLL